MEKNQAFNNVMTILVVFLAFVFISFFYTYDTTSYVSKADSDIVYSQTSVTFSNITYKNGKVYAINTLANQLMVFDLKTNSSSNYGGNIDLNNKNTTFEGLNNVCVLPNGSIFLTDNRMGIRQYAQDFEFINYHEFAHNGDSPQVINKIVDMCSDFKNNIYAIESTNSSSFKILKKSVADSQFNVNFVSTFGVSDSVQLLSSYDSSMLFIYDENKLWTYENGILTENITFATSLGNIEQLNIDYKNNLYILSTGTNATLSKFVVSTETDDYVFSSSIELGRQYKSMDFDYESGRMYFSTHQTDIYYLDSTTPLIDSLNKYQHSVDWVQANALSNEVKIGITLANTVVYKQPIEIVHLATLASDTKFIILNDNLSDTTLYSYVLVETTISNEKQLVGGYILKSNYQLATDSGTPEFTRAKIISNNTKVYKYPTTQYVEISNEQLENLTVLTSSQVFSTNQNNIITAYSQILIKVLAKNSLVTLSNCAYNITDSNIKFYQISLNSTSIGYILQTSVIEEDASISSRLSAPNSEIKLPNDITSTQVYSSNDGITVIASIENKHLVFVDENTNQNGFVKIEFLSTSDEIVTGYVRSDYVKDIGISIYIIIGIGLLLVAIFVALICIYVGLRKKSKSKQNNSIMV